MMDKLNGSIFLIKDDELLEKYNAIWDKVSADIKKDLILQQRNFENQSKISW